MQATTKVVANSLGWRMGCWLRRRAKSVCRGPAEFHLTFKYSHYCRAVRYCPPALLTASSNLDCFRATGVTSERQENPALSSAAENTRKQARALVAASMVPNAVIFAALRVLRTADWLAAACGTGWESTRTRTRIAFD